MGGVGCGGWGVRKGWDMGGEGGSEACYWITSWNDMYQEKVIEDSEKQSH